MCRTVDRQFPPSRKVTLQNENGEHCVVGRCKYAAHIKITEWKEEEEEQAQFLETIIWEL